MMTGNLTLTTKQSWPVLKGLPAFSARHQAVLNLQGTLSSNEVFKAAAIAIAEAAMTGRNDETLSVADDIPGFVEEMRSKMQDGLSTIIENELDDLVRFGPPVKGDSTEDFCGPASNEFISRYFVSEAPAGRLFTEACRKHDMLYATPGVNKEEADQKFLEEMLQACTHGTIVNNSWSRSTPKRKNCEWWAHLYYRMVRDHGHDFYESAQNAARNN